MSVVSKHLPKINVAEDMVELRHILLERGLTNDEASAVINSAVKIGMYYAFQVLSREDQEQAFIELTNEYRYGVLH